MAKELLSGLSHSALRNIGKPVQAGIVRQVGERANGKVFIAERILQVMQGRIRLKLGYLLNMICEIAEQPADVGKFAAKEWKRRDRDWARMTCQRPWRRPGRKLPAKSTATEVVVTNVGVRRHQRPQGQQRMIRPHAGHSPAYCASLI